MSVPALSKEKEYRGEIGDGNETKTDSNSYTLDFHKKMPFWGIPEAKRNELWDDGVHFTAEGYDLMGVIIADRLIEVIEEIEREEKEAAMHLHGGELKKRLMEVERW